MRKAPVRKIAKPRPSITLRWELLNSLRDDGLDDLVREHWREVGVHKREVPLVCDWDRYQALEDSGVLKILAARKGDALIGYNSFLVMPGLHYATTIHAHGDAIFVTKRYRKTGAGVFLIDRAETALADMARPGYVRIIYHDKAHLEYLGPVLRKRGYGAIETIYDKIVKAA